MEEFFLAAKEDDEYEQEDLEKLRKTQLFNYFFDLSLGDRSADNSVVVGSGGFLFVNDGSNFWKDQLSGNAIIDEVSLQTAAKYLNSCRLECEERGIQFRFVVIPEKDIIYPELSPNALIGISQLRSIHKISEAINFPICYAVTEMMESKPYASLFHARNSHYNFFGGFIIANNLLKSLSYQPLAINELSFEHVCWPDDLSKKWGDGLHTRRRILARIYEEQTLGEPKRNIGKHLVLIASYARTDDTVMIFGDSYSWNTDAGLSRFMTYQFRKVHFLWKKIIDWELVRQVGPKVIILQSAERFLLSGLR